MTTTPIIFHLKMTDQESCWLALRIEHYFTNAINGHQHLLEGINDAMEILEVLRQIRNKKIAITVSHYQAKLLTEVIYDSEKRWHVKKNCTYLPDDFDHRDIYDQLKKLAERQLP